MGRQPRLCNASRGLARDSEETLCFRLGTRSQLRGDTRRKPNEEQACKTLRLLSHCISTLMRIRPAFQLRHTGDLKRDHLCQFRKLTQSSVKVTYAAPHCGEIHKNLAQVLVKERKTTVEIAIWSKSINNIT